MSYNINILINNIVFGDKVLYFNKSYSISCYKLATNTVKGNIIINIYKYVHINKELQKHTTLKNTN